MGKYGYISTQPSIAAEYLITYTQGCREELSRCFLTTSQLKQPWESANILLGSARTEASRRPWPACSFRCGCLWVGRAPFRRVTPRRWIENPTNMMRDETAALYPSGSGTHWIPNQGSNIGSCQRERNHGYKQDTNPQSVQRFSCICSDTK